MQPITELGHGRQGQTKMGGVKWVSNPCVRKQDTAVCLSDVECSYPGGVASYPQERQPELTANT